MFELAVCHPATTALRGLATVCRGPGDTVGIEPTTAVQRSQRRPTETFFVSSIAILYQLYAGLTYPLPAPKSDVEFVLDIA